MFRQPSINKSALVVLVTKRTGLSEADTSRTIDALIDSISDTLRRGGRVMISGFGRFEIRERAARPGRNPVTGEATPIRASKRPGFKPAPAFKKATT